MYSNSQEDKINATSTLMRKWSWNMKVLMKFLITEMWTSDYIQLRIIGLRIESIQNETGNYNLDNTDNPLERNMIYGSESALAQLNLSVIFVMARVRMSSLQNIAKVP